MDTLNILSAPVLRSSAGHPNAALPVSALLVVTVALADYLTGYELTLSILYFGPLFICAWRCSLRQAVALSVFATAAWAVSDVLAGHHYSHPFYRWWEGGIKLVTWIMFVMLLTRLKRALERSDERFVTVLDRLDAIVYVSTFEDGRLLYANPSCRELLPPHAAERALPLEARWQPSPAALLTRERLLDRADHPHAGVSHEFRDETSGRRYLLHARAIRWIDGRWVRLQVGTDITERHAAELQALARQTQMENESRLIMLGEMASTLAHELNQPVAAVNNYARGILRRLDGSDLGEAELRGVVEKMALQAERAGRIVNRVRELSRRRDPRLAPASLHDMAQRVQALLEPELEHEQTQLQIDLPATLPPVRADSLLIEQALLNLCRNALDAMSAVPAPERILRLSAAPVDTARVEVCVSDTGCGVPPEVADRRQELFFTTRADGTGIGLHVCRSVLEGHGTRLTVTTRDGGGSIFSFSLEIAA